MKAQVYRSAQREFDCYLFEEKRMIKATALGSLLKGNDNVIVPGDFVNIANQDGQYVIESLEERKNSIFRVIVRERKKKVMASNCDLMVIMTSVSKPNFKRGLVDRYLVRSENWGIPAIIVFNKMDQFNEGKVKIDLDFEVKRLQYSNVKCFEVCAKDVNYNPKFLENGFKELSKDLEGKTALFLGQSGVGKSKIISALSNGKVQLKSKEIAKVGKGAHTTTWSELVDCDNFKMIDSPGVRSYSLEDLFQEELLACFPDVQDFALKCKFVDCQHEENSKGCAFHSNSLDELEREIILSRLESYQRILFDLENITDWEKKRKR